MKMTGKEREANERQNKAKGIAGVELENFVPPDGGWGWIVVLGAGFANFCVFPVLQNFGLIFREKFSLLGITSSQTTTIININSAVTACIGLANGPLFRRFTYRQISLTGAFIVAVSISTLSMMKTFAGVLTVFSILYGAGTGISSSANSLALNTYFKKRRRIATGFSWTCTGLGPIIMPQVITFLMPIFGVEGTVLIFGGFAFNAVACALLLQPVSWHVKKDEKKKVDKTAEKDESGEKLLINETGANRSLDNNVEGRKLNGEGRLGEMFGSQYLYYEDDENGAAGIDVFNPGTPMMSRANDGWYSRQSIAASNTSLASNKTMKRENSQKTLSRYPSLSLSRQSSCKALSSGPSLRNLNRQNSDSESRGNNLPEKPVKRKLSTLPSAINSPLIMVDESCEQPDEKCANDDWKNGESSERNEKNIAVIVINSEGENAANAEPFIGDTIRENEDQWQTGQARRERWYKRFWRTLVIFFDLDLLRDLSYVNLLVGVTFANLAEINFSLLTPFILEDYGLTKAQTATTMSILGGCDVATRLTIPFIAGFIGWQNKFFFIFGVCMMALGRAVLAHYNSYEVVLALSVWIGIGKGFKTIFMALVIPTHVTLDRLPGATGLQLLFSGIVFLALGPLIGLVRDKTGDFTLMLHLLNFFTFATALSWLTEKWVQKLRRKKQVDHVHVLD